MAFSENLIKQRKIKGLTQDDIAEAMEVSRQSVSKWENGESMPDFGKIVKLADLLEVSIDSLFDREHAIKTEQKIEAVQDVKIGFSSNWIRTMIITVIVLIIGGVAGFLIASSVRNDSAKKDSAKMDSAKPDRLEKISVSAVELYSTRDGDIVVEFVPSVYKEGYTYTIQFFDKFDHSKSCEVVYKNGKCTGSTRVVKNCHYTIILQVEYNGETQNITLARDVTQDGTGMSYEIEQDE